RFEKELTELVRRKVKHKAYHQDIIQEVYLKILTHQSKIIQANNISAYLTRLTINTVMDYYRRKGKSAASEALPADISIEPEETPDRAVTLADCCLHPFIDSLPAIYREALVLAELENMSIKDYAAKVNISVTNAKTRVQRARIKLRAVILQCCQYEFDAYGNIVSCVKNTGNSCCQ